ncbi:hypothetical protein KSF_086680 [Reticulibacter mediterranei]|uniref:Uncharacterized protein n=1 Tax=Reticulibacter mediterranei TaxID=2778369 RepID=A0A8J3N7M0_9CHLR|nr:hypothetical protein [Reticulibacter mediterranei]GHO98620.1 hypothetical protein KSF_086680 [Reticulibacter mediterranei]
MLKCIGGSRSYRRASAYVGGLNLLTSEVIYHPFNEGNAKQVGEFGGDLNEGMSDFGASQMS